MARRARPAKIDPDFLEMLKRKNIELGKRSFNGKPPGLPSVTKSLATPDFEKLIDDQLSKRTRKLFRFK